MSDFGLLVAEYVRALGYAVPEGWRCYELNCRREEGVPEGLTIRCFTNSRRLLTEAGFLQTVQPDTSRLKLGGIPASSPASAAG